MTATLDWLGCATFRLSIGRLVVFLDAYVDRVPSAPPVGIAIDEIDRADWIVVGHSHFDHLYGAERIAAQTGAKIVGSYETVRVMKAQGVPLEQLLPVAGGERVALSDDVTVEVFPSQHSCIWTAQRLGPSDEVCIGDLGVTYQEQQERLGELTQFFGTLSDEVRQHMTISAQGPRGDGGALVYLFDTPEGRLLYQDTSGHWSGIFRDLRPDVAILPAAGRGNIAGEPIPGVLAQSTEGEGLPGFSKAIDVVPIRAELARVSPRTELLEMGYLEGVPIFKGP